MTRPVEAGSAVATLRDVMNTAVVTTAPQTPLAQAAAAMVAAGVGSAVVMQGSFLAGIVTERDVLRAAASGEDLRDSAVSDWMTADPQSASPDSSPEEAAQIMLLNGFRHLPVVDGRNVCGLVTLRDLFAARIRR
jgi:CBS domain-containing protein